MSRMFKNVMFVLVVILSISASANSDEKSIVEDGKPNAEIMIAENAKRMVALGALELRYYLEKMTGAKLPIVTKPDDNYPVKIYVGESEYAKEKGVTASGLQYEAFRMVSGDNWLALVGEDADFEPLQPFVRQPSEMNSVIDEWDKLVAEHGGGKWSLPFPLQYKEWWNPKDYDEKMSKRYGADTKHVWNPRSLEYSRSYQGSGAGAGFWYPDRGGSMNAVCEFLRSLGVRWYMPHEVGEVVPKFKSVSLPKIEKTVRPDFQVRSWNLYNFNGPFYPGDIWVKRLGMNTGIATLGYARSAHFAGHARVYSRMKDSHPEYIALYKGKRDSHMACYSSEGLAEETVRHAKFMYDHYGQPAVSLWPADGFRKCECELCRDKTPSELVWGFVNRVAGELYKTHPDRLVVCGAYTPYVDPPSTIKNLSPNVLVFIANRGRPLFDNPEKWKNYWDSVESWKSITAPKRIIRGDNNRWGLRGSRGPGKPDFPIIHPRQLAKDLHDLKGISIGERGEVSQTQARWAAPGCDHLTLYVQARLVWDADRDVEEILEEYYRLFYGPAEKEAREALEFAQAKYKRMDRSNYNGTCNPQNVSIQTQIKLVELLRKAREVAGDTIYGQRIDVILGELLELENLQAELKKLQEEGDFRAEAMEIEASNLQADGDEARTYKLQKSLFTAWSQQEPEPELETTFSVRWTEKSLIFDMHCKEPDMESLRIGESVWEGDSIVLLLESPNHSYYQIEVDPDGRVFDADRWGSVVTKWSSMADVKIEKGDDFWRAVISIPIAISGEEGAEGDPLNYVVGPRIQPGGEWFFNLARRRPREADSQSLQGAHALSIKQEGSKKFPNMHRPEVFAKLLFE